MDTQHRTGRDDEPAIAVVLTREQAFTAAYALADQAHNEAESMVEYLTNTCDVGDADASSSGRRLRRILDALEVIGWPHRHDWDGRLDHEANARGPWGKTKLARRHDDERDAR